MQKTWLHRSITIKNLKIRNNPNMHKKMNGKEMWFSRAKESVLKIKEISTT